MSTQIPCSISDDDLCSGCESHSEIAFDRHFCSSGFPAQRDENGYVVHCVKFIPFSDVAPYDDREDYARCSD